MDERKRNAVVGITTLAGLLGLIALLLIFGYLPSFMRHGYPVRLALPNAAGLHEGSPIFLSGIHVGEVERVELVDAPLSGVMAHALIRENVKIPANVTATVNQPFIGGGASVALAVVPAPPGSPAATEFLARNGEAVIQGDIPNVMGDVTAAVARFETVAQNFEKLSDEWTRVGENINALVELRQPEAVDKGEAEANLATVMQRTDKRLAELESVLKGIDTYVNDPKLRGDVQATIANARSVSDRAAASVTELQEKYAALADRLSVAADSANGLLVAAREGDGTLGKMLTDPAVYQNLNDAMQRAQAMIDEARLLIQKWKAEGLPVQF